MKGPGEVPARGAARSPNPVFSRNAAGGKCGRKVAFVFFLPHYPMPIMLARV